LRSLSFGLTPFWMAAFYYTNTPIHNENVSFD